MTMNIVKNHDMSATVGKIELDDKQINAAISLIPCGYLDGSKFVLTHLSVDGTRRSKRNSEQTEEVTEQNDSL